VGSRCVGRRRLLHKRVVAGGLTPCCLIHRRFAERRFVPGDFVHGHLGQQRKNFFLDSAGNARFVLADVHVHFAAHSEFRQVNSRLHGEA
jgi:hypothetical protein